MEEECNVSTCATCSLYAFGFAKVVALKTLSAGVAGNIKTKKDGCTQINNAHGSGSLCYYNCGFYRHAVDITKRVTGLIMNVGR